MKKKNLDLAAEMGEDIDVTEEQAIDAATPVAPPAPVAAPVAAPAVAQSQPITLTFEQLQALMASANASQQQSTQALADALTQGIKQAQPQRPSNEVHPDVSAYNPAGERDFPRPGLKCEFFYGTRQPKTGLVQRSYAIKADDLTAYEQIALNTLTPQEAVIQLLDSSPAKIEVVPTRNDITGDVIRMVIVVPSNVMGRKAQLRNSLPSLTNIVAQLTANDYGKLSLDDLKWFMAQHRVKNYVAVREAVAA